MDYKNFSANTDKVFDFLDAHKDDFVKDTDGTIYSTVADRFLYVASYDLLTTPQDEMYGDVVLIWAWERNKDQKPFLVEVHWYKDGVKYASYDKSTVPCVTVVPRAYNALL